MRVINDYHCAACDVTREYFVENCVSSVECQSCGAMATKVLRAPRFQLDGTTGDFPTAADKWVKSREQKMKAERKAAQG